MKIAKAIFIYLEQKALRYKAAAKAYPAFLKRMAEKTNNKDLEAINNDDLNFFNKKIQEEYKAATASYHMIVVRNFFKFWNNRGMTKINLDELEPAKFVPEPYHAVTEHDFEVIDDFLDTEEENFANIQKRLIVRFLWETGCRVGELCRLNWKDIDQSETGMQIETEKRNGLKAIDWIFWSETTHVLLLKFLRQRANYIGQSLFVTYEGRMKARTIQRFLSDLGKKLGFDYPLSPHCFRHGKAMFMEKMGAGLFEIQKTLRHSDPKSSERYLILGMQRRKEIAKKYLQFDKSKIGVNVNAWLDGKNLNAIRD